MPFSSHRGSPRPRSPAACVTASGGIWVVAGGSLVKARRARHTRRTCMTVRVMAGWRRRRQQRQAAGEAFVGRRSQRSPTPARMHGPARRAVTRPEKSSAAATAVTMTACTPLPSRCPWLPAPPWFSSDGQRREPAGHGGGSAAKALAYSPHPPGR